MVSSAMIDDWLDTARSRVNAEQFQFLRLAADRVQVELGLLQPENSIRPNGAEPLRCLLHRLPGTGKSHVLKMVEELFGLVGYKKNIDWAATAYQATNATDLEGRTIHNFVGLSVNPSSLDKPINPDTAQRLAYVRWLLINEISMVPANLLGATEQRLRQVKPNI